MVELFFIIFMAINVWPLVHNFQKNRLFTPDTVFLFSFFLYRVTMPLNYLYLGNDYGYSEDFVYFELILSILFIGVFLLSYHWTRGKVKKPIRKIFANLEPARTFSFLLVIFGFLTYLTFLYLAYGNPIKMYAVANRVDFYKSKQGFGSLVIGREVIIFGLVLAFNRMIYQQNLIKGTKFSKLLIVAMGMFVLHNLLMGDRNPILNLLFGLIVVFWVFYGKTKKVLVFVTPIFLVVFLVFGVVRSLPKNESYIDYLTKDFKWDNFDPTSSGELTAHFKIDHDVLYISDADYKYGSSYLEAFVSLIPKNIVADRPEYLSEWYARRFHRDTFESGGGFGFSLIAESYINFGAFGMVIIGWLLGYILKKLFAFTFNDITPIKLTLYGIILYYIFILTRSGITPLLKPIISSVIIPYYIFVVFFKSKVKKKNIANNTACQYN